MRAGGERSDGLDAQMCRAADRQQSRFALCRYLTKLSSMLRRSDRSVIVAVVAVRMMQVSGNHEVDMVAVWHFGVPALRVMLVATGVVVARVLRRARGWISATDADRMLVGVPRVNAVQVSVVKVVGMALVLDGSVAASGAVRVGMRGMLFAVHGLLLVWAAPLQGKRHAARSAGSPGSSPSVLSGL